MGAVASTSEELQMVAMDDSVWKSMPEDLIERILAWLPIHSLFRMRCVCKQWSAILSSERFATRAKGVGDRKFQQNWTFLPRQFQLVSDLHTIHSQVSMPSNLQAYSFDPYQQPKGNKCLCDTIFPVEYVVITLMISLIGV